MSEPTVTVNPTEQLIAAANQSFDVTDARGRTITLRKPGVLAQFRLVEALGETASNATYVNMVLPLLFVHAVDGEQTGALASKVLVEALIQRLDDDGIAAVIKGVEEHFGKQDAEADRAALKNA